MNLRPRVIFLLAILAASVPSGHTQFQTDDRQQVLDEIIRSIQGNIYDPELAPIYTQAINQVGTNLEELSARDDEAFALAIHRALQEANPDGHLGVYGPQRTASILGHDDDHSDVGDPTIPFDAEALIQIINAANQDVALVHLEEFTSETPIANAINHALSTLPGQMPLIFDLRGNRGGDALHFRILAGCLFADFTAVHGIEWRRGETFETVVRQAEPNPACAHLFTSPLYVLTNQETASTAELMALVLQNRQRATIVGEETYGASHPAEFFELHAGFGLMVPIGRAFDPETGEDWEGSGVQPDIVVAGEAALDAALLHLLGFNICQQITRTIIERYDCTVSVSENDF